MGRRSLEPAPRGLALWSAGAASSSRSRIRRAGAKPAEKGPRRLRRSGRVALQLFAFAVTAGVMLTAVVAPSPPEQAYAGTSGTLSSADIAQSITIVDSVAAVTARDTFEAKKAVPVVRTAPAVGVPDPGTAQAIAYDLVIARGWDQAQFDCLVALWNKESHWNVYAHNTRSGAYGIPQAMPGNKMASVGADWQTNPRTQIVWGLGYIQGRYTNPCGAWAHSGVKGWY